MNGVTANVEFEYLASNFILHGHDVRDCDLVICWKNDAPEGFPLPVLSIVDVAEIGIEKAVFNINYADPQVKELWYWKHRATEAEREARRLQNKINEILGDDAENDYVPHLCDTCGREFSTKQALSAHSRWCNAKGEL